MASDDLWGHVTLMQIVFEDGEFDAENPSLFPSPQITVNIPFIMIKIPPVQMTLF